MGAGTARVAASIVTSVVLSMTSSVYAQRSTSHNQPPEGFAALFNGRSLDGWQGLVGNPITRAAMSDEEHAAAQIQADARMRAHWHVENGELVTDGHGPHLCTTREYGDIELLIDWRIAPGADSGIYLRGSPQVQIWDPVNGIDAAKVGSGGLYNNQRHRSTPLAIADRPAGEWNTFHITMIGERVTVRLNGVLVVDDVPMENYWDRTRPIFPRGQIELQTHGAEVRFRNIFVREIDAQEANERLGAPDDDSYKPLFNGRDLSGWIGALDGYAVRDGAIICREGHGGNLFTEEEYDDFILRFEFRLPPVGNNGLAIRAPLDGDPAYAGIELQILNNPAPQYAQLQPYQYHGSAYGIAPAHRGYLRPAGQWNIQDVTCRGSRITVQLNGTTILDVDLATIDQPADGRPHPGMHRRSGHLGFARHHDPVAFRRIRIKRLSRTR